MKGRLVFVVSLLSLANAGAFTLGIVRHTQTQTRQSFRRDDPNTPILPPSLLISYLPLPQTGDVNLNPLLRPHTPAEYVWGDMLNVTQLTDVMAIQHEGTLAERYDPNPQVR